MDALLHVPGRPIVDRADLALKRVDALLYRRHVLERHEPTHTAERAWRHLVASRELWNIRECEMANVVNEVDGRNAKSREEVRVACLLGRLVVERILQPSHQRRSASTIHDVGNFRDHAENAGSIQRTIKALARLLIPTLREVVPARIVAGRPSSCRRSAQTWPQCRTRATRTKSSARRFRQAWRAEHHTARLGHEDPLCLDFAAVVIETLQHHIVPADDRSFGELKHVPLI